MLKRVVAARVGRPRLVAPEVVHAVAVGDVPTAPSREVVPSRLGGAAWVARRRPAAAGHGPVIDQVAHVPAAPPREVLAGRDATVPFWARARALSSGPDSLLGPTFSSPTVSHRSDPGPAPLYTPISL